MNNYFEQITRDMFIGALETLKVSTPGTPEFEFGFQVVTAYKIWIDRKSARIGKESRILDENKEI